MIRWPGFVAADAAGWTTRNRYPYFFTAQAARARETSSDLAVLRLGVEADRFEAG